MPKPTFDDLYPVFLTEALEDTVSKLIDQELVASGTANVIVILREQAREEGEQEITRLSAQFTTNNAGRQAALALALDEEPQKARYYPHLGVAYGSVSEAGLAALREDDAVAEIVGAPQLSIIRPVRSAAARLEQDLTWGLEYMEVPRLWEEGYSGEGVIVGHLDTGVDGGHEALSGAVRSFADFDSLGRQRTPTPPPYDSDEHGTHTAATIAGRPVNGRSVGVAPAASLASAVVIEGGDAVARVLGGMDWVIAEQARVLSMSLGFRGFWEDFVPIMQILRDSGVLPVIAVGNEGPGTSRSPGNYAESLCVGAHDRSGFVANFSSSEYFRRQRDPIVPDVAAPGVDVISAKPGGGYQSSSGSSMATPHVAGLAALLLQAKPNATVNEVEEAMLAAAIPGTGGQSERLGRGVVNARKALDKLTSAM